MILDCVCSKEKRIKLIQFWSCSVYFSIILPVLKVVHSAHILEALTCSS